MINLYKKLIQYWHDLSLSIKGLLIIALPLAIFFICLTLLYSHESKTNILENKLTIALKNQHELQKVHTQLMQASKMVRDYLLTGDKSHLDQYRQLSQNVLAILISIKQNEQNPKISILLNRLNPLVNQNINQLNAIIKTDLDVDKMKLAEEFDQQNITLDKINSILADISLLESQIAQYEQNEINIERESNLQRTVFAEVISIIAALIGAWIYMSEIVKRVALVRDNARRLAHGEQLVPQASTKDELGELSTELELAASIINQTKNDLVKAKQESEQASAEKSRFLSRTSHELRTPLNAILGFAQLLEIDLAEGKQKDAAFQITNAGNHLLKLINEVLDIARIESGEFTINLEKVNLSSLLNEAVQYIKPLGKVRDIDIDCNYSNNLWVTADPQRLMQVVLNLLSNALKYGPVNSTVHVSASQNNGLVKFDILDEGNGIPADLKKRLFTPFDRLGAEQSKIEGTGLGLAVSKQFVTAMQGNIDVDDNKSLFWVSLNAAQNTINIQHSIKLNNAIPDSISQLSIKAIFNILYVEDNASNRALIEAIIRRNKSLRLYCVETLLAAKQLIDGIQPHVVLLDLNLPDGSGETLITFLRASQDFANTPIIVLSADASPETIARTLELGASDYLVKPINVAQFNLKLNSYISQQ